MDGFMIERIEYGWFKAFVGGCRLVSSNVADGDAPRELLECVAQVLMDGAQAGWVAWRGEPEALIMELRLDGTDAAIRLWSSSLDAFELGEEEAELRECRVETVAETKVSAIELLDAVVSAFALYANGNGRALYEAHWGEFPDGAFDRLKAFALDISRRREAKDEDAGLYCGTFMQ